MITEARAKDKKIKINSTSYFIQEIGFQGLHAEELYYLMNKKFNKKIIGEENKIIKHTVQHKTEKKKKFKVR